MSATTIATWIIGGAQAYLILGAIFSVAFSLGLAGRIDPGAKHSSWGFKLLILPSATLLWPLLLRRVLRRQPPPVECNAHRVRTKRPSNDAGTEVEEP